MTNGGSEPLFVPGFRRDDGNRSVPALHSRRREDPWSAALPPFWLLTWSVTRA